MSSQNNDEDFIVSDFHIDNLDISSLGEMSVSRLELKMPHSNTSESDETNVKYTDTDGDLTLPQRPMSHRIVFLIEHERKSRLSNVGMQLWNASLLLCDYLIEHNDLVRHRVCVDLGAGIGLNSFVALALDAKRVYCTDLESIVAQAQVNFKLNEESIRELRHRCLLKNTELSKPDDSNQSIIFRQFDWSTGETGLVDEELRSASVYLASDVIYDTELTRLFMRRLYELMSWFDTSAEPGETKHAYIANEKRINLAADDESGECYVHSSFDYFVQCLKDLDEYVDDAMRCSFRVKSIVRGNQHDDEDDDNESLSHKQVVKYFSNYKRNSYLYIWQIESMKF